MLEELSNRAGLAVPSRSDTALRTTTVFDDFGRMSKTFDPTGTSGVEARTEYDFAGRRIKTTDNYVDGTPGGGTNNDQDRTIEYAYTSGLMTSTTRRMPSSTDDQVTTYTYGTTKGSGGTNSQIATGHLLRATVMPEQFGGQSTTARSYSATFNALGETITSTDPVGHVITTTYDLGGRTTAREATTIASGYDARVKRIESAFDNRGLLTSAAEKNSSGTVLDEVTYAYGGWGNMTAMTQDPDSAVTGGSGRSSFAFTYNTGRNTTDGDRWQRLYAAAWTQPGGVTVSPDYSGGDGLDLLCRRVSLLANADLSEYYVVYDYLGTQSVVGNQTGSGTGAIGASYDPNSSTRRSTLSTYLDRFNRPIKTRWIMPNTYTSADPIFIDLTTDYNRVGNVTAQSDAVVMDGAGTRVFDQSNTYDDLRRLLNRDEGQLNTGRTAIATKVRSETRARTVLGVPISELIDLNANAVYTNGPIQSFESGEKNDSRTTNKRGEALQRTVVDVLDPTTARTVTPTYDANGNLTDDGEMFSYLYDAFNRLVQVKRRTSVKPPFTVGVVANYTYNAFGQRISEQYDINGSANDGVADGAIDSSDPVYFLAVDRLGRRVATYRASDANPKETFIHHGAGLDPLNSMGASAGMGLGFGGGVVLRDRDSDAVTSPVKWATAAPNTPRAQRHYYFADSNGSVMALLTAGGTVAEQYRYSATGVAYGLPAGDMDGDGEVKGGAGQADAVIVANTSYQVRKDLNLDGVINSADAALVEAATGNKTGRGQLTTPGVRNRIGYMGREVEWDRQWVLCDADLSNNVYLLRDDRQEPYIQPLLPDGSPSNAESHKTCCKRLRARPGVVDQGAVMTSTCCGTDKIICSWVAPPPNPGIQMFECNAAGIVAACQLLHEQRHVNIDVVCNRPESPNTPASPTGAVSCAECYAYTLEQQCLTNRLSACWRLSDAKGTQILQARLALVQRQAQTFCAQCARLTGDAATPPPGTQITPSEPRTPTIPNE